MLLQASTVKKKERERTNCYSAMSYPFKNNGQRANLSSNFIHDNHSWERLDLTME
jgi:hypothetical protein